mgnify:CR=1 FL=1
MTCSHPVVHHHGVRRRRCSSCGKSWTLWKHRRGRKPRPRRLRLLARTFQQGLTVTQQALGRGRKRTTTTARHDQLLRALEEQPWSPAIPSGRLILIIDGLWFWFESKRWTLYVMAVRSIHNDHAVFLRPILKPGRESQELWQEVIGAIPHSVRNRISALISDSLRGMEAISRQEVWVFQRCHFHLFSRLYVYLGRNKKRLRWRLGRERSYQAVRQLVATIDQHQTGLLIRSINRYARHPLCPRVYRSLLQETLRRMDEYRTYLQYPDLNLPTTTNVIESLNSRIRAVCSRSRGFRTPQALQRWVTSYIRFNPTSKCRAKKPTELFG